MAMEGTVQSIEVSAAPQFVFEVALHLEAYPEWVTGVKSVEILEEDAGEFLADLESEVAEAVVFCRSFYTLSNPRQAVADTVRALCPGGLVFIFDFTRQQDLERLDQTFRELEPESFDLVISNGVLHHTAEPFRAFQTISGLVKPGGYILVGLYHRWGRLVTDFRRRVFRSFPCRSRMRAD